MLKENSYSKLQLIYYSRTFIQNHLFTQLI